MTWTAEFSKGFWIGLGVGASLVVLGMLTRVVG